MFIFHVVRDCGVAQQLWDGIGPLGFHHLLVILSLSPFSSHGFTLTACLQFRAFVESLDVFYSLLLLGRSSSTEAVAYLIALVLLLSMLRLIPENTINLARVSCFVMAEFETVANELCYWDRILLLKENLN